MIEVLQSERTVRGPHLGFFFACCPDFGHTTMRQSSENSQIQVGLNYKLNDSDIGTEYHFK